MKSVRVLFSQSVFKSFSGLHMPSKPFSYNTFYSSLVKATMRWVYSLFLASLAVFAWIDEELFWFSQDQVVDYAARIALSLQVSFEAGN